MSIDPYSKAYDFLVLDRVGTNGRIGRVTLNRPDKLNALNSEMLYELSDALHRLEADFDTRVIILRGAGRAFSAGYDLAPPRDEGADAIVTGYKANDDQGRRLVMGVRTGMQQVVDIQMYFWNMAKVTIAQVHGYALAGGLELAMMADLVVASTDAQLGHPGVRFGTSRNGAIWPLVIGMRKAKELYYTGASVSGTEAAEMGMINHAWDLADLEESAIAFADNIGNLTSDHLAMLKQNMNRFYENMGIYSSIRSSTDFDAMSQFTDQAYKFHDKIDEARDSGEGIGPALDWRDGPYSDYRASQKLPDNP
ncbi:enoyl-CoA hydratase-related protein [uncultured Microbacterium sp.]|uniref:enoyl-CoA hydratase-related protein n=1 Tax=uncultured Microbacterium sp. TaxID=191216 RepID=UPI0035C9B142